MWSDCPEMTKKIFTRKSDKILKLENFRIPEMNSRLTPSKDGAFEMALAWEKPAPVDRPKFFKLWMKYFFRKVCPPIAPERCVPQPRNSVRWWTWWTYSWVCKEIMIEWSVFEKKQFFRKTRRNFETRKKPNPELEIQNEPPYKMVVPECHGLKKFQLRVSSDFWEKWW